MSRPQPRTKDIHIWTWKLTHLRKGRYHTMALTWGHSLIKTLSLTKRIFASFWVKQISGAWFTEVERYLQKEEITRENVEKRDLLGAHQGFQRSSRCEQAQRWLNKEKKRAEEECGYTCRKVKSKGGYSWNKVIQNWGTRINQYKALASLQLN